ncbi:MAG TPA: histidinol-phosphate transaminase [Armatimonadetes bacterium]|nr:histidinol-phosphate transaminase [Armatimonadota bacterium]
MAETSGRRGIESCVKPQVAQLRPYSPGKPISEVQRELGLTDVIKLASNENPFGPAPRVVEAIRAALPELALYPDAGAVELRTKLAGQLGVTIDHLSMGNGSDELLQLIGYAVLDEGDELVIGDPTFARYEPQATLNRARAVKVPLRDMTHDVEALAAACGPRTKAIFLANPHNPAGTFNPDAEVEWLCDNVPEHVLVVLDEAYYEFVDQPDHGRSQAIALARPNVLILRTFSKVHALAALRVGYALARPELIRWIEQVREPFNVNSLAQVAALAALDDTEHVTMALAANASGRERLYAGCAQLGLRTVPSQANFVLIEVGEREAALYQGLLRRGVIVRGCTPLGFPGYLRITVGTPEQVERCLEALGAALGD